MKDLKLIMNSVNANLAHTCGNITAIIAEEFKSRFPKNYFRYEHVATRLAFRQFAPIRKVVDFKKQKPILAYQPKLILDRDDRNIDMIRRLYSTTIYDMLRPDYHNVKFFKDTDKGIYIDFSVDRLKMNYEFTVIVGSEYQQYNTALNMQNKFRFEHPYYINAGAGANIETLIPKCIISQISKDSGIPILDQDNNPKPFLDYLNKISNIPITFEFQPATGNYQFFMVIRTNIYMNYTSFSVSDGEKDGQISDSYPITLQLEIEANYPNCFYYLSENKDRTSFETNDENELTNNEDIRLYYTFQRTIVPDRDEYDNAMYLTLSFKVEDNMDEIDISGLFTKLHKKIMDGIKSDYKAASKFINIVVYEDGELMCPEDYYADWNEYKLKLKNVDIKLTYRMVIYIDSLLVNNYKLRHHEYGK